MRRSRLLAVLGFLIAFNLSCFIGQAATPGFTLAATDVTESSSGPAGTGAASITVSSVDGYTGIVQVVCNPPATPSGVKIPFCNGPTADPSYTLTANQKVTAKVEFFNAPLPEGVVSLTRHGSPLPALAAAGMLLWGVSRRRKSARLLTLILFGAGSMASLAAISACGGSNNAVTPGTYVYTLSATDAHTASSVSTTVKVTVP